MLLHTFFIVKKRIDVSKIVTDLSLYRKYWIDFTWGVTNVARSRCTCSGAGASWSRRKVCARNDICAQQFSETGPWRTFVLLYDLRRSAKASYIVSRACERSRLSERFSASSIFWSALPRLLLNGRAINYVNQKGHRASWWNDIGDIYRVYSLIKCRYHRFYFQLEPHQFHSNFIYVISGIITASKKCLYRILKTNYGAIKKKMWKKKDATHI